MFPRTAHKIDAHPSATPPEALFSQSRLTPQTLHRISIAFACAVCLLCLVYPRMDGDAGVYALISKHMVEHQDWVNLFYRGHEWLDKPHFPFWMVALSFEVFGISERAYLVPGLVFYCLGAYSTYLLARHFYGEKVASLSSLIYLSLLGILLGTSDQKAEIYLLGLMPGATLAWLRYEQAQKGTQLIVYGLVAAMLSAFALMSKGVFVLGLIGIGVVVSLVYRRAWSRLFHWKWLLALLACLFFITPEIAALYLQFDLHPEKVMFGRTHVSGVRFFFWDGQFGRFMNSGPIQNSGGSPWFFVHNFLWTFFPWSLMFFGVVWAALRQGVTSLRRDPATPAQAEGSATDMAGEASVVLWSSVALSFVLFSITKYQMDYYMIIAFPYATILCSKWCIERESSTPVLWSRLHLGFAGLMLALALVCTVRVYASLGAMELAVLIIMWLAALAICVAAFKWLRSHWLAFSGTVALVSVTCLFAFSVIFHYQLYVDYNVGYALTHFMRSQEKHPMYLVNVDSSTFDLLSTDPVVYVQSAQSLVDKLGKAGSNTFYMAVYEDEEQAFMPQLSQLMGRSASTATALHVQQIGQLTDVNLPKQFIKQVFKDDAKLQKRNLKVLRVNL